MLCFAMAQKLNAIALAATVIGLINSGEALCGAITEPLIGQILDHFWDGKYIDKTTHYFSVYDYQVALSVLPVYLVCAFIALLLLKQK